MKVSLSLEVSDPQRNALARLIEGKDIKRLATRDEVRAYVTGCVESLQGNGVAADPEPAAVAPPSQRPFSYSELLRIDPEDEAVLKDKEPGFIVGWNKVKRRRDK